MDLETIKRHWSRIAPKLIAFLATGLTASGLIGVLAAFGIELRPDLAATLVGATSSIAAYIVRDKLLDLAPGQFSLKVLVFILTSVTAVGLVAFAGQIGFDLTPYTAAIGVIITAVGGVIGYLKSDVTLAA